jgi:hypothetical protein
VVGNDGPEGVHHICVAVQAKDLFLGIPNGELASSLDVVGAGHA